MEKITKEFYVYDFNELKEDVKKELIEKERDYQRESYCELFLEEDMNEKASNLINDYFGITSKHLKVYYDLSYSQGSGTMVEFDINIANLNKKYKIFTDEEIRFLQDKGIVNDIRVRHNDSHYYHEYTFGIGSDYYSIDWCFEDIEEEYNISESEFDTLDDRIESLLDYMNKHHTENQFVEDIISINKELTKYGYENIEYYWNCSEEEIIGYLEEYKYLESGEIFNEI